MDRVLHSKLTDEDYASAPADGKTYQVVDGELLVTLAPNPFHQRAAKLTRDATFAASQRARGQTSRRRRPIMKMRGLFIVGAAAALMCLELWRPLRRLQREPKARHTARNLTMAGLAATTVQLIEQPVVMPLARAVARRGWGLLPRLGLPRWLETVVSLVALDYTLYLWHMLVHRTPALWRFHAVHHLDLDLDVTTAVRFHFGELAASVPWRAAQVVVIGVNPRTLTLWQSLTLLSVLFHHSNVRLSRPVERALGYCIVTPRMHGIHHSTDAAEINSNWSSGLSLWDRVHGTLKLDVAQEEIRIGIEGYQHPSTARIGAIIVQPFVQQDPQRSLSDQL